MVANDRKPIQNSLRQKVARVLQKVWSTLWLQTHLHSGDQMMVSRLFLFFHFIAVYMVALECLSQKKRRKSSFQHLYCRFHGEALFDPAWPICLGKPLWRRKWGTINGQVWVNVHFCCHGTIEALRLTVLPELHGLWEGSLYKRKSYRVDNIFIVFGIKLLLNSIQYPVIFFQTKNAGVPNVSLLSIQ